MTTRTGERASAWRPRSLDGDDLALLLYGLVWLGVLVLYTNRALHHAFTDDFWEHVANIARLAEDPSGRIHPLLGIDAPSALASPYALALAMIARFTGLAPATVFTGAGFVATTLLAVTLLAFVRALGGSRWTALTLVVLTLVFWGPDPRQWSGFLNLGSITYVLAYPSTIAMAVALGGLALALRPSPGPATFVSIAAAGLFVSLTHPYTWLFAATGLIAFGVHPERRRRIAVALGLWVLGAALGILWPLYPVLGLLTGAGAYAAEQAAMYEDVIARIFPALACIAALIVLTRADPRGPLLPWVAMLATLYVAGWVTGVYSLGRVLSQIVFLLHTALALVLVGWIASTRQRRPAAGLAIAFGAAGALALVAWPLARSQLRTPDGDRRVEDLVGLTPPDAIVMADPDSSRRIPAVGRYVVEWPGALPFVPDIDARRAAGSEFFMPTTSATRREAILDAWKATWVLVDLTRVPLPPADLAALGAVRTSPDGSVVLVEVSPPGRP